MRFQITYSTGYEYSEPVRDNLNVLRVKPATTRHQSVDDFSFRVDPEARLHQYRDYFGSEVIEFGVTRTCTPSTRAPAGSPSRTSGSAWRRGCG